MRVPGLALVLLAACGSAAAPPPRQPAAAEAAPPPGPSRCIADRTPERLVMTEVIDCHDGAEEACAAACDDGDPQACTQLAQDVEFGPDRTPRTEDDSDGRAAATLYARACHLGSAPACTNYGAYLLHDVGGVGSDPACAARLHAKSCEAGDPWGCAMRGLELWQGLGVPKDVAAARAVLERSCKGDGGPPCDVLARMDAEAATP